MNPLKRLLILTIGLAFLSQMLLPLPLSAKVKEIKVRGYITSLTSPTSFEIEDYRVTRDESIQLEFDNQTAGVSFKPEGLRHTFATRLLERGVHQYVISTLLGHAMPLTGFGHASRITPGYAHTTWEAMVAAVELLEHPVPTRQENAFGSESGKILANQAEERKAG